MLTRDKRALDTNTQNLQREQYSLRITDLTCLQRLWS